MSYSQEKRELSMDENPYKAPQEKGTERPSFREWLRGFNIRGVGLVVMFVGAAFFVVIVFLWLLRH